MPAAVAEFMRKLEIQDDSGGPRGDRTWLRNQIRRLFGCSVSLIYKDDQGERFVTSPIAESDEFFVRPGLAQRGALMHLTLKRRELPASEASQCPDVRKARVKLRKACARPSPAGLWSANDGSPAGPVVATL